MGLPITPVSGHPSLFRSIVAAILVAGGAASAVAATQTWTGTTNNTFSTTTNWTANGNPSGNTLDFGTTTTNHAPNLTASITVVELDFTSANGAYQFSASSTADILTLSGATGMTNAGTGTETFSNNLAISASQIWSTTSSGSLTLSSTANVSLGASHTLTLEANTGSTITLGGIVSGTGTSGLTLSTGTGTVVLGGANTYTGATAVGIGTLELTNAGALQDSSGVTVTSGATLELNGTLGSITAPATTISGTGVGSAGALENAAGTNTYGGALTLGANAQVTDNGALTLDNTITTAAHTLTVTGTGTTTISGNIQGTGALTLDMTGSGSLTLSGTNNYTGATTVSEGTLSAGTIVVSAGTSDLGNAASAVVLGGASTSGDLSYTGNSATFTRGFTVSAGGGEVDVTTSGQTLTIGTGGVAAAGTFTVGGAGNTSITSVVSGAGGLTMAGTGTLTVANANTYTGVTTISDGTLSASTLVVAAGKSSLGNAASAVVLGGASTSGDLSYTGTSATFTRGLTVNAGGGEVDVTTSGQTLTIGTGAVAAAGTLTVGGAGNTTITSAITGAGGLTMAGTGTSTLTLSSGSNTFSGATTVDSGTLVLGNSLALQDSTLTAGVTSGTVSFGTLTSATLAGISGNVDLALTNGSSAAVALTVGNGNVSSTFSGTLSGNGSLIKTGTGTFTIAAANASGFPIVNTYTGTTTINGGTLAIAADSNLGTVASTATAGALTLNGGTLGATTTFTLNANRGISLGASGGTFSPVAGADLSYGGIIAGAGNLTMSGAGTLTLSGTNTYTGTTTVSAGTLQISADSNLGAAPGSATVGSLTLNGGTLENTASLTLSSNRGISLGASGGTFLTDAGTTLTYGGIIAGAGGALTKNGTGTLTLDGSAASTYTGATTVNSGTLALNFANMGTPTNLISSSSALVLGGGTLNVEGKSSGTTSQTFASTTIANGASTITRTPDGGTATNVALGAITRNVGGTVNFSAAGTGNITTTSTNTSNILGGYATVGGTDWASVSGGNIVAATYSNNTAGSTSNDNVTTSATISTGANSLRFATSGAQTLTLTGNNVITSGGILVTTGVGNHATLITGGGLEGASGKDLVVINNNTQSNLTIASTVKDNGTATGLTAAGAGTVIVTGTNTYTGLTTVSGGGTLQASNGSALGTMANGVTVNGGTLALNTSGTVTAPTTFTSAGTLTLNDNGGGGSLINTGGSNAWLGNITLSGNATISNTTAGGILYLGVGNDGGSPSPNFSSTINNNGYTLTLSATAAPTAAPNYDLPPETYDNSNMLVNSAISGAGGLNITGTGVITLNSQYSNTYTGATNITINGELIIDQPAYVVGLSGDSVTVGTAGSSGAVATTLLIGDLASTPGDSYVLGTQSAINTTAVDLTIYGNGELNMNGSTQGLNSLTLQGGTIMGQSDAQQANSNPANNNTKNFNPLLTIGATVDNTAGAPVSGGVTVLGGVAQTSTLSNGIIGMSGNGFTFNVASTGAASGVDLLVNDNLVNGYGYTGTGTGSGYLTGSGVGIGLVKTGAGTMVITSDNTLGYQGVTDVQNGVLNIQNNNALGQTGGYFGDLTNSVVVEANAGAQLQLQGGLTISTDKTLTLNNGIGSLSTSGALRNIYNSSYTTAQNTNTWNGEVVLGSSAQINADSGSFLNLVNVNQAAGNTGNGIIFGSGAGGQALTFGGGGTTLVNGAIENSVGNIIVAATDHQGTPTLGTVIMAGINSYTGTTTVSNGTLEIANTGGLAGSGATVAAGATLAVAKDFNGGTAITVGNGGLGITINGTGTTPASDGGTGNGAIENLTGNNSIVSTITLGSASTIKADSGTTLTLAGAIAGAGQNLTLGGTGNISATGELETTTGTLTKIDSGTVTLASTTQDTFTGATTIVGGTLAFGASNQFSLSTTTNSIAVDGGATLSVGNFSNTISELTGSGAAVFGTSNASSDLILNGAGGAVTISTDVFTGSFSGTGTLTINAGASLTLGADFSDSNLNIVLNGGTLYVDGNDSTFGTLTIDANSTLDFSLNGGTNSIIDFVGSSSDGGVIFANTGLTLDVTNWTLGTDYFYSSNLPTIVGSTGMGSAPLDQINFVGNTLDNGGTNTTWEGFDTGPGGAYTSEPGQILPVPEPSFYGAVMTAFALALAAFWTIRRRSENSNKA